MKKETKIFNCQIPNVPEEVFNTKYRVGIIDLPWEYRDSKSKIAKYGGVTYDQMTMKDIIELKPFIDKLFSKNAIIFSWGTWPKLDEFEEVRKAWGWEHVTGLPWIKVKKADSSTPTYRNIGRWVAGCSEYCCFWRRGKISPPKNLDHYLGLVAVGGYEHSKKPTGIHDIAEELTGPYVELFGRVSREGWTTIGNEVYTETQVIPKDKNIYESFDMSEWSGE